MSTKSFVFAIFLFCAFGCKFFAPVKDSGFKNTKDWRDLPDRQTARISVPPFSGSLGDLLPRHLGKYRLTESKETVQSFSRADQTWVAHYESFDGGTKLYLYMQKFGSHDHAYSALISEAASRIAAEVTKIETAVKKGEQIGTKVCLKAPGENNPQCSTALWTNGSVAVTLSTYNNLDVEDIYRQMPF
jgi:hypothetical protein